MVKLLEEPLLLPIQVLWYLLYSVWGYRPVAGIHDDSYDLEQELVDEEAL